MMAFITCHQDPEPTRSSWANYPPPMTRFRTLPGPTPSKPAESIGPCIRLR
jgi:hypothetical protein